MPVVPSCLLEPAWVEFRALLDERRGGEPPSSPRVIPGAATVAVSRTGWCSSMSSGPWCTGQGMSGSPRRAAQTAIRRRLRQSAAWGLGELLHAAALRAYDQMIGLELADVAVDGCMTKAPCGGDHAGPSPVDRRKGGLKR